MNRDKTHNPNTASRRRHDPADSEAHAHRRAFDGDDMVRLHDRVGDTEESIKRIDATLGGLVKNMEGLTANTGRLADVLEAWGNVKGFWWTLKLMGAGVRILLPIVLFCCALAGAIWLFGKTGHWDFRL